MLIVAGRSQQIAPRIAHVQDITWTFQQRLDEPGPAIRRFVGQEGMGLGDARDATGQIEIDAPQKLSIVGERRRLGSLRAQFRFDDLINSPGQGRRIEQGGWTF